MIPGEIITAEGTIELAPGRQRVTMTVENAGDRPVQVGSHYHFAQANPALSFDRDAARGYRLDIPAGTSVRTMPWLVSEFSMTLALSSGTVKLGQPEPLSYLWMEANRGSPDTMST